MSTLEDIANVREIDADDATKCCYANGWAADGLPLCHRNPHVLICLSLPFWHSDRMSTTGRESPFS